MPDPIKTETSPSIGDQAERYEQLRAAAKALAILITYHPPFGDQAERYEQLRDAAKALAILYDSMCPPSREKSLALTNAAIARNEKEGEGHD